MRSCFSWMFLLLSFNCFCQESRYFIQINEKNSNFFIEKDKKNNITKIVLNVKRTDMDFFQLVYESTYKKKLFFSNKQHKYYLNKKDIVKKLAVDFIWVKSSVLMKKIAFGKIKTKLFFIRDYNNKFYEVIDAGILFSFN